MGSWKLEFGLTALKVILRFSYYEIKDLNKVLVGIQLAWIGLAMWGYYLIYYDRHVSAYFHMSPEYSELMFLIVNMVWFRMIPVYIGIFFCSFFTSFFCCLYLHRGANNVQQ